MAETIEIGVVERDVPNAVAILFTPGEGFFSQQLDPEGPLRPAATGWVQDQVHCGNLVFVSDEFEAWFDRHIGGPKPGPEPDLTDVPPPGDEPVPMKLTWLWITLGAALLVVVGLYLLGR